MRLQRGGQWEPAVVLHKARQPRSYVVQAESGQLRRNMAPSDENKGGYAFVFAATPVASV